MAAVNYFWHPLTDNVIEEYDDAGDTIAKYTTEPEQYGNLISQERGGATNFYHYDGQGSTLALTDESGDVTDTYAYNAFGETTAQSGVTTNPFRYIGQYGYQYDEVTNSYYVRTRVYTPATARWTTRDPLKVFLDGLNLYRYARNSPYNFIDPSGLSCCNISDIAMTAYCEAKDDYDAAWKDCKIDSDIIARTCLVTALAGIAVCIGKCSKSKNPFCATLCGAIAVVAILCFQRAERVFSKCFKPHKTKYFEIKKDLGIDCIPDCDAFRRRIANPPNAFQPDPPYPQNMPYDPFNPDFD